MAPLPTSSIDTALTNAGLPHRRHGPHRILIGTPCGLVLAATGPLGTVRLNRAAARLAQRLDPLPVSPARTVPPIAELTRNGPHAEHTIREALDRALDPTPPGVVTARIAAGFGLVAAAGLWIAPWFGVWS